jgi:hypothetical protein
LQTSFNERFDQHGTWRRDFALRLKLLGEWMKDHDLVDSALEERLQRLETQVRSDKVMVAFVAEFSRGKSELINAIFFAGYGRRIMPASAGRTTMCPTELGYDANVPPSLRLLPIETRLRPQSLMEWRMVPEKWTRIDLDVNDPKRLAITLEKVAETRRVTQEEARLLGFWHSQAPEDNPPLDSQGLVEIPMWRHALINIAHPLLKQGLVILDTPGLNAIGAEPELTVSLIPQAQAVVFLLGADTGVTKTDLAIWREHLSGDYHDESSRLVVLNKIDTLWDALSTPDQVQHQIDRQQAATAEILGVRKAQVIPVSAHKGLLAKVTNDTDLLSRSALSDLEDALSQGVLGQRRQILGAAVTSALAELRSEAARMVHIRRRDLSEQAAELRELQSKNSPVIKNMRSRISQEQTEFDLGGVKIHAVRSVHLKLLREVFKLMGPSTLKVEMGQLTATLQQKGIKFGVKRAYGDTFERLRASLTRVQVVSAEIQAMLAATFRQLNSEYGFSLLAPAMPEMKRYLQALDQVEQSHLKFLSVTNVFRLAQPEFSARLVRALSTRLRVIHEAVLGDIELWSKSATSQLDAQLRERRRNFSRRLEAIDRIQQASGGLNERIAEIEVQGTALHQLEAKLGELTGYVVNALDLPMTAAVQVSESV